MNSPIAMAVAQVSSDEAFFTSTEIRSVVYKSRLYHGNVMSPAVILDKQPSLIDVDLHE